MCAGQALGRHVERRPATGRPLGAAPPARARGRARRGSRGAGRGRSRAAPRGRCRARCSASSSSRGRDVRLGLELRARDAQLQRDGDEVLLRAVVEVALQPAALLVARLDQAGARGDQVRARLRAGDGERDELAERAEPRPRCPAAAGPRWRSRPRPRARRRRRSAPRRRSGSRRGRSPRRSRRSRTPPQSSIRAGRAGAQHAADRASSRWPSSDLAERAGRRRCRGCGGRRSSPSRRPA